MLMTVAQHNKGSPQFTCNQKATRGNIFTLVWGFLNFLQHANAQTLLTTQPSANVLSVLFGADKLGKEKNNLVYPSEITHVDAKLDGSMEQIKVRAPKP